jgi:hypothetical protein
LTTESCTPVPELTEPLYLQMASISSKTIICKGDCSPSLS